MYAGSGDTTQQSSHDIKQNPPWPKGAKKERAGLVALRRDKASSGWASVGGEKRRHMIELAAYYRAEQRGFVAGGELQDWLDAEQEIGARFISSEATIKSGGS
ncbi:MAG: DUF2934 domain-containing protein [Gammaproteobacteria bacterium]|jgi:hypothetical protein